MLGIGNSSPSRFSCVIELWIGSTVSDDIELPGPQASSAALDVSVKRASMVTVAAQDPVAVRAHPPAGRSAYDRPGAVARGASSFSSRHGHRGRATLATPQPSSWSANCESPRTPCNALGTINEALRANPSPNLGNLRDVRSFDSGPCLHEKQQAHPQQTSSPLPSSAPSDVEVGGSTKHSYSDRRRARKSRHLYDRLH